MFTRSRTLALDVLRNRVGQPPKVTGHLGSFEFSSYSNRDRRLGSAIVDIDRKRVVLAAGRVQVERNGR